MDTLGMLIDKLTIVKLKQYHGGDKEPLQVIEHNLLSEIDAFVENAVFGVVPRSKLTAPACKVYKKEGNEMPVQEHHGLGSLVSELAHVNCELWHVQEKVYDFESVPADKKDEVIRALAVLNLQRNNCIDTIDRKFAEMVT